MVRLSAPVPAIRRAEPGDLARIQSIIDAAYSVYIDRIGRRPMPMDDDHSAQIAAGLTHVVDENPTPGLVVLTEEEGGLVIHNVAVDPARQGEGIGRALVAFAEAEARRRGHSAVRLYTHELMTENQALYSALGYERIEGADDSGIPRVFMAKDVRSENQNV